MKNAIVLKFGGTSVADVNHIKHVRDIIIKTKQDYSHVVVVVSAMNKTTDNLIKMAKDIASDPYHGMNRRELDMLLTTGERITISLLSMALNDSGVPAISFTGSQVGIVTDNSHNQASIKHIKAFRIIEELQKKRVVVVAGFQGVSVDKEITTLGRGGSDTTAVALAIALGNVDCHIYTDVEGVYSADPRYVPNAFFIKRLNYRVMTELAHSGAKVLHPRAVALAARYKLPVRVRSTFSSCEGTLIQDNQPLIKENSVETPLVNAIAHQQNVSEFNVVYEVEHWSAETQEMLLKSLDEVNVPVNLFSVQKGNQQVMCRFFCDASQVKPIYQRLNDEKNSLKYQLINVLAEKSMISVVGDGIGNTPQIGYILLNVISSQKIQAELIHSSYLSYHLLVEPKHSTVALALLHHALENKQRMAY